MQQILDLIIIGGGHAGLSLSYLLSQHKVQHVVLEKGRIGESWRKQRWDSFEMITPNKMNLMPGQLKVSDPEGFSKASSFIKLLENYVQEYSLPVFEDTRVMSVFHEAEIFRVETSSTSSKTLFARILVIASGGQNKPVFPALAKNIPKHIFQLHSADYKNPESLPKGNILVVGSGQSGMQICIELAKAGRSVFLSTSPVGQLPRRYRGKDITDWLIEAGYYDQRTPSDPAIKLNTTQPHVSETDYFEHGCNYSFLQQSGVQLLGTVIDVDDNTLRVLPDTEENVSFSRQYWLDMHSYIDKYINEKYPRADYTNKDVNPPGDHFPQRTQIAFGENGISTIIWATGFTSDFDYIKMLAIKEGRMVQNNGISTIPRLYCLGLPRMRSKKSGIIWGIREDADFILKNILKDL